MNTQGFNTVTYPNNYAAPVKNDKSGPVNIYIQANTPNTTGACYPPPPCYPCYYPLPYYTMQPAPPKETKPAAQKLEEKQPEPPKTEPKPEAKPEKPAKTIKPLDENELDGIKNDLAHGDKEARKQAITSVIKLLNEDRENRKDNPAIIGLLKTAGHANQPKVVREIAEITLSNLKSNVDPASISLDDGKVTK